MAVVDCDAASGERTVAEIERRGRVALLVHADISKETDAERLASETTKVFGGIDVLANMPRSLCSKDSTPRYRSGSRRSPSM